MSVFKVAEIVKYEEQDYVILEVCENEGFYNYKVWNLDTGETKLVCDEDKIEKSPMESLDIFKDADFSECHNDFGNFDLFDESFLLGDLENEPNCKDILAEHNYASTGEKKDHIESPIEAECIETVETDEKIENPGRYSILDEKDLNQLADANTLQKTKMATKWAVKQFQGMFRYIHFYDDI